MNCKRGMVSRITTTTNFIFGPAFLELFTFFFFLNVEQKNKSSKVLPEELES